MPYSRSVHRVTLSIIKEVLSETEALALAQHGRGIKVLLLRYATLGNGIVVPYTHYTRYAPLCSLRGTIIYAITFKLRRSLCPYTYS